MNTRFKSSFHKFIVVYVQGDFLPSTSSIGLDELRLKSWIIVNLDVSLGVIFCLGC